MSTDNILNELFTLAFVGIFLYLAVKLMRLKKKRQDGE